MADISSIVLPNDATAYNIKDATARLRATTAIGYCTTAAGTKDKVVTLDPNTASSWSLEAGAMISVVFLNTSTYDGTYDVTLNVNSTGAYPVVSSETISNVTSSGISRSAMGVGRVPRGYRGPEGEQYTTSTYIFNGTYWICISCDKSTYVSDYLAMTPHLAFAECSTAAGTKDKVATISGTPFYCSEWNLSVGAMVFVKFTNTNTYSPTSANHITLNVNGTGAYDIYYEASNTNAETNTMAYGYKNYINCYVFDGDYWVFSGRSDAFEAEDRLALIAQVDNGPKNKLINAMTDGSSYGIAFAKKSDETITVSGTASGGNAQRRVMTIPAEDAQKYNGMVLSGCPIGGSSNTYKLVFQRDGSPYTIYASDYGNGEVIQDVPAVQCRVFVVVNSGTTIDATFKPMLCTAADYAISTAFAPYRPSWQEMWEMIQALQNGS